jgi:hypothetical protein
MTATTSAPARISPEHLTSAVLALAARYEGTADRGILPLLADALDDAGCDDAALLADLRAGHYQITPEGARIVVVGRDGASHDRHGNGIYATKVYEAAPRKRDGLMTWRLVRSVSAHRTAGKGVTGPMIRRAEEFAAANGLPFAVHITHGTACI